MKLIKLLKKSLISLLAFGCCSFTIDTDDVDIDNPSLTQEEYDEEMNSLDPNIDKIDANTEQALYFIDNPLNDEDIKIFRPYITIENNQFVLNDEIYSYYQVDKKEETYINYDEDEIVLEGGRQSDADYTSESYLNLEKIKYVKSNINFINNLANCNYGYIQGDQFIFTVDNEFNQESFIFNTKFTWYKTTFKANYQATMLIAFVGFCLNFQSFKSVHDLFDFGLNNSKKVLRKGINAVISEVSDNITNLLLNNLSTAVSLICTIYDLVECSNIVGLVIKIFKFIFCRFVPGLVKSSILLYGSLLYKYGCDCTIGWFYSEYKQIHKATY